MRLLRCLGRLSSNKKGVAISRVERRLAQRVIKPLGPVRYTIEHLDSAIRKGEIKAGKPHGLAVDEARWRRVTANAVPEICLSIPRRLPGDFAGDFSGDFPGDLPGFSPGF